MALPAAAQPMDQPRRQPDGSVFVPKPTQRLLGVRAAIADRADAPVALQLVGQVIADPNASGRVQAPLWPVLKQSPTPGYAWMPAGGPLERGLMQAVHALTSSNPTEPRQLGDLGNQMLAMNL